MGTFGSLKRFLTSKFKAFEIGESDEIAEQKSPRKPSPRLKKKRHGSPVDNYAFLQTYAGGLDPERKKVGNKPLVVYEVDEAMKERILRSDVASQSSSRNCNPETFSGPECRNPSTSYRGGNFNTRSHTAATDRKNFDSNNEPVPINSDEDDDDDVSKVSSNDCEDNAGPSGEIQTPEHDVTSHEMEPSVVIYPKHVTYGRNRYWKAQLTFSCASIKLEVSEQRSKSLLTFEWKTADLVNIESRWCERLKTANVCLHIKSRHQKVAANGQNSGISEVKFPVSDPHWAQTQELIKSLDERYMAAWDVDLDSFESFEDFMYLEGDCGSISISKRDFQLLQPEKFINDTIVDLYIEYLKKQIMPADRRFHFFNSFFFRKLADFHVDHFGVFDSKEAFQRVRKWTKKVDLFQKDYVFIPINFRLHWSLIVICHPGEAVNFRDEELEKSSKVPCILHMDSIKGSHRGLDKWIKCYLCEEWKERSGDASEDFSSKFTNLRFLCLELPQQQNSYDCGLFMLHYMELFVKQAPDNFNPLSTFLGKDWFYPTEASLKRARIRRLFCELAKSNPQKVPSPGGTDKHSSEYEDAYEEDADIQFLHETYNPKETCRGSKPDSSAEEPVAVAVTPLRSAPPDPPQDDGESFTDEDSWNYGKMVLFDSAGVLLSTIKEDEEAENALEKRFAVIEPPPGMDVETTLAAARVNESLQLRVKENHESEEPSKSFLQTAGADVDVCSSSGDNVPDALVVDDSERSSSSSSDVFETCVVVEDSDSDAAHGNPPRLRRTSDRNAGNRLKRGPVTVSEGRKRVRRSSRTDSEDLQEIFPCE